MRSSYVERVCAHSRARRYVGALIETWKGRIVARQGTALVSEALCKIGFLRCSCISQIRFDLSFIAPFSICGKLRDCDRRQDSDDCYYYEKFYKSKP